MLNIKLFRISLIISLLGTFTLLLILEYQELPFSKISEINKDQIETKIKTQGTITSIKETPGLYILTIKDSNSIITTIVFKEEQIALTKNSLVEIEGKIQEYQNELEIIADKITELK